LLISDENVSKLLKRNFGILVRSVDRVLAPNISLLCEIGLPKSKIMLMRDTRAVELNHAELKSKVEELVSFGLNPTRLAFLDGLNVLCALKS
jgi:hypothetical protein